MAIPPLIYCADGNEHFARTAVNAGYAYGARMPATVYLEPEFVDQDWKKAKCNQHRKTIAPKCKACAEKRQKLYHVYMERLEEHRPKSATVIDWEWQSQIHEVLEWAESAAAFVETIIIIPKVHGGVAQLSRRIGNRDIRLGFSVATGYGATPVTLFEFIGWPVHLLGGSPGQQLLLSHYLDVASADGNMMLKMATEHCAFWQPGKKPFKNSWPSLKQANDGRKWGDGSPTANAHHEAFRRSCANIMEAWQKRFLYNYASTLTKTAAQ